MGKVVSVFMSVLLMLAISSCSHQIPASINETSRTEISKVESSLEVSEEMSEISGTENSIEVSEENSNSIYVLKIETNGNVFYADFEDNSSA